MILYMDSFDHYALADLTEKWTTTGVGGVGSATSISSSAGRHSSSAFQWITGSSINPAGFARKTLAPGDATFMIGFALKVSGSPGSWGIQLVSLYDTNTSQLYLRLNTDLTISVLRGDSVSSSTLLGTSSVALVASVFGYVECKVLIGSGSGTVVLRVNGAEVLNLTGQNTQTSGAAQWNNFALGQSEAATSSNAGSITLDFDDLYVSDGTGSAPWNGLLGDCRVDPCLPTAAGATTAWTPSAGSNWQNVDDATPNDDTDYNSAATSGLTDTFVTQNAPAAGATIYGIQHCLNMKKTEAGVCTVAPVIRHSGVDYPGAALSPGISYAYGLQIAATNPGTGAAWVEADFNAAEFGYRRTA